MNGTGDWMDDDGYSANREEKMMMDGTGLRRRVRAIPCISNMQNVGTYLLNASAHQHINNTRLVYSFGFG